MASCPPQSEHRAVAAVLHERGGSRTLGLAPAQGLQDPRKPPGSLLSHRDPTAFKALSKILGDVNCSPIKNIKFHDFL